MIQGRGDIYSNLIGYIGQMLRIEKRMGRNDFEDGITYWWYNNPTINNMTVTKSDFRPEPFMGDDNWILLAKTYEGQLRYDANVLKGYGWPNEED